MSHHLAGGAGLGYTQPMDKISIGLLGGGTVGSGVARVLRDNAEAIEARLGAALHIARVAVRDLDKERDPVFDPSLLTLDVASVIEDPNIAIVVVASTIVLSSAEPR